MTGNGERKISSLRELPLDIAPPRDLWQGIEARISAGQETAPVGGNKDVERVKRFGRVGWMQAFAAAAVIAALAVGIWIGRAVVPGAGVPTGIGPTTANNVQPGESGRSGASGPATATGQPGAWRAEYVMDSRYVKQRAELVKGLEARLATLPPDSRAKVLKSLKAIDDSKRDLEAELGKDPTNALLQELLVNTYQDEMRVLTAVHEAGSTGEGI
jgi:hypothetical protein